MTGRFRIILQQHLDWLAAQGHELRIQTPPRYEQLWRRAREAGLHLGELYLLRAPLEAHVGGSYNRESGDIWVVHSEDRPEAGPRNLLHELAHARRRSPMPESVDRDWDEEREVWLEARDLGIVWGEPDLIPEGWLEGALEELEKLREWCHEAATLVGTINPRLARAALAELREIAGERGWDEDAFWDALYGVHEDPQANAAVAELDRCGLRSWSLPGLGESGFGELELPQDETTARWLRSTLAEVARGRGNLGFRELDPGWVQKFATVDLSGRHQLVDALALCNEALLGDLERVPLGYWHCYRNPGAHERIYRLSVAHSEPWGYTEVWILCAAGQESRPIEEAALQRYIKSFARCTVVRVGPLEEGMAGLWAQLARRKESPSG